jgi:predicted O-linked N-acetylglucosamine transferase (SPINDLY family)
MHERAVLQVPLLHRTRESFRLREDAIVYLCCQHVYKFLPENDWIFVEIAKRVPNASFVFVALNRPLGEDLRRRLERGFASAGLQASHHCVLIPKLTQFDYWNLHLVADIYLDTIGWSSGASTFDAVACRLPVVTMVGEFMRGRQAYAILSQLGVKETIAWDREGYVDIAVQLAADGDFRKEIGARMLRGHPQLFEDRRCVDALEGFLSDTCSRG